jgi:hypothetical protein
MAALKKGRKIVHKKKKRKTPSEMDDVVADLRVMKIKQKTGSNGDWLLRRSRPTQPCSAERVDEYQP